jgi:regulator of nucleoside diphosphate kinase
VVVVDLDSGEQTEFTVVVPADADTDKSRISVLDPLGMAILGYRSGQEIEWEVAGRPRRWMVRRVIHQPEAAARQQAPPRE